MFEKYSIESISDILALRPDQRERCCADLLELGRVADSDGGLRLATGLRVSRDRFVWVDDNETGTVSGVIIGDKQFDISELEPTT
tara:strand:+ start:378 stop:632 length:255 start_codon:yes stop_codon:yes gene_type:complete